MWLVTNAASGRNTRAALAELDAHCRDAGLRIAQHSRFPDRDLPLPEVLDAADIDLVAIFAGDGTINATLAVLAGWEGAVLVLPGGTMNLLHGRLFGAASLADTLRAAGSGEASVHRPPIITGALGPAYTGLLAGPGTAWNEVREALRDADLANLASDMREAIATTLSGAMVRCIDPPLGREEGYPLLMASPQQGGIALKAYYAENLREYLEQGLALARRDFREGPHDLLGIADRITLAAVADERFGLLLDGEPARAEAPAEFTLAPSPVNLLATRPDGA